MLPETYVPFMLQFSLNVFWEASLILYFNKRLGLRILFVLFNTSLEDVTRCVESILSDDRLLSELKDFATQILTIVTFQQNSLEILLNSINSRTC